MSTTDTQPIFLQAFNGNNKQTPVWFMRQAGRYLPQYRAIKEKYPLEEMFGTPELAAEITCMPVDLIGVDAAILFADILTLPSAMGIDIRFDNKKGPIIDAELSQLTPIDRVDHVEKTIKIVKRQLGTETPLIGFAGSPFTVLTYLLEGGSSLSYAKTLKFIKERTADYHACMTKLTENTIQYLNLQKESGIDAFQIFDTWAGILPREQFEKLVLPYVQEIYKSVELPSIYFVKNCRHLLSSMNKSGAEFLSVCHTIELGESYALENINCGVQGNLFNGILYDSEQNIREATIKVLEGGKKHKKFIFNLNHGMLPDMDPEKLKVVVKTIREFNSQND